jgi:threonine dehydrogenase-like Zn-dependent dehydrogenase
MPPDSARIAVLASPAQDFEILRYPLPSTGPGEILVRVTCCTICGS